MKTIPLSREPKHELLRECNIFSQIPEEILDEMAPNTRLIEGEDGEILFRQGQTADGFYLIVEGQLEIFRQSPDGRRQTLHDFYEGELSGQVPVFQGGKYPASACLRGLTRCLYVPGGDFLDMAMRHPEVLLEMLAILSQRLRKFVNLIDDLSLKEVSARLAGYLIRRAEESRGDRFTLDCEKRQLASRIGTIPETLSRALNKLQQQEIIRVEGREITIVDRAALEAMYRGG